MLDDGAYDALVVDAHAHDAEGTDVLTLTVTIVSGVHKGETVEVRAQGLGRDELDLLAVPATLVVLGGEPEVHLDD